MKVFIIGFRLLVAAIFITFLTGVYFTDKVSNGDYKVWEFVNEGKVINKYIEEYACGKHKRYTCKEYVIQFSYTSMIVSADTYYNRTLVGYDYYHYISKDTKMPKYVEFFDNYNFYLAFLLFFSIIVLIFSVEVEYDERTSNKENG